MRAPDRAIASRAAGAAPPRPCLAGPRDYIRPVGHTTKRLARLLAVVLGATLGLAALAEPAEEPAEA